MGSNVKYILMYLGEFFVLVGMSYILADWFNRIPHSDSKDAVIDRVTVAIFLSFAAISLILPYFILQSWPGVVPPFLQGESVHKAPPVDNQLEEDLRRVATSVEELNQAMKDPTSMKIKDMQKLISENLSNIGILQAKIKEQQRHFSESASAVKAEKIRAEEAKKIAEKFSSLTREQVKELMKDSQDAANKSFFYGVLVSFPIGILSSLIASMLYKNIKDR